MKVYGFPLSPFVRKVHLAAAEKGIAIETVLTNPGQPDAAFLAASPFRKIPALVDGDFRLADSTAIVTYFEAVQPEPALLPAEPRARARAVWFEEVADTVIVPAGVPLIVNRFLKPVLFGQDGDEAAAAAAETALEAPFAYLDGELGDGGWLDGASFTVGDLSVASVVRTLGYGGWSIDSGRWPKLAAWYARVCARPAWIAVAESEAAAFKARTGG